MATTIRASDGSIVLDSKSVDTIYVKRETKGNRRHLQKSVENPGQSLTALLTGGKVSVLRNMLDAVHIYLHINTTCSEACWAWPKLIKTKHGRYKRRSN